MEILGIDIGGSGIKGAIVNIEKGTLESERHRIPTPQPSTPEQVAESVATLANHFQWKGKIGCGFPATVQNGTARTAANIDKSWIGTNVSDLFSQKTGCTTSVVNDADAAGLAELNFGAGKHENGVLLMLTIGTGIGSALFTRRLLVPNTELGHIYFNNMKAEHFTSDATRKKEDLKWQQWGERFNAFLLHLESTFWPDKIIVGGGTSKKFDKFHHLLTTECKVVPAELLNNAGIIGAAMAAHA